MIIGPGRDSAWLDPVIERYARLLVDLSRVREGTGPSKVELRQAPLIMDYRPGRRGVPCLVGRIAGHPEIEGSHAVTSDLLLLAPEWGWARTLSRFYRLGEPLAGHSLFDA